MYDPTIFDNLKVAFENHVYDLDNMERLIDITNRRDRMDFSIMARDFSIQFKLVGQQNSKAEIVLKASLQDLSAEILEKPGMKPGCKLILKFYKRVQQVNEQCRKIEEELKTIWEDQKITQQLSFVYEKDPTSYLNVIEVAFNHKINEDHMGDIGEFLDHVLETLDVLNEI